MKVTDEEAVNILATALDTIALGKCSKNTATEIANEAMDKVFDEE